MVSILPEAQAVKDGIPAVDEAIIVSAVRWLVVLCQRKESVRISPEKILPAGSLPVRRRRRVVRKGRKNGSVVVSMFC